MSAGCGGGEGGWKVSDPCWGLHSAISLHQALPALPLLLLLLSTPPCAPQASGIRGDGE